MNLNCVLGHHTWDGCRCRKCLRVRDEQHDWKKDCSLCSKCGARRTDAHDWHGCKCRRCSLTRDEGHDFHKDCSRCSRCGTSRSDAHHWNGCKCHTCGKTRDQQHDWGPYCSRCAICGAVRPDAHEWNGCTCRKCGLIRDEQHDWGPNRRCRICDARRADRRNFVSLQRHEVGTLLIFDNLQARDAAFELVYRYYHSRNASKHLEKRTANDALRCIPAGMEQRNYGERHFIVLRDSSPATIAQMEEHKLLCAKGYEPAAVQPMYYQEILESSVED